MNPINNNNNTNYSIQDNHFVLKEDLSQAWRIENKDIPEEPIGADRTFHVQGKSIKIHSYVMANASLYFRSFFYGNFKDKNATEICIDDCSYEEFKSLQGYIYSGQLELDTANVLRLYELAEFFGISKLEMHCINFIKQSIPNKCAYYYMHLNHLNDDHPLKIILNDFLKKKEWPGISVKGPNGIVPLAPNEACFEKYKLSIGSRLTFVDKNHMKHKQTILGIDSNNSLWTVDDRSPDGDAIQYSHIHCKSDLKKAKVQVINQNFYWLSKKEIEQNLQKSSPGTKFTKFITKHFLSKNGTSRWYCRSEIFSLKGSKIKLVSPYQCYQEYGISPGDIFIFKTRTDQGGIVEGMDEDGKLWVCFDNEKGASSISTKETFYENFKIILQNPLSPFSQDQHSINDKKDLILELASQRDENFDLTFFVEEREIHAHTSFLATRSPYFKAKLAQRKSNQIRIRNCAYKHFKTVIDYLYTGQIDCELSDILPLYKMAIKMQISSLQKWCEMFLTTDLPITLFADYYAFIQFYPAEHPLKVALNMYINKNQKPLIELLGDHPEHLACLSDFGLLELLQHFRNIPIELFNLIDTYICHQKNKIRPEFNKKLIELVDFSKFSLRALFSKIDKTKYLEDETILKIARDIICKTGPCLPPKMNSAWAKTFVSKEKTVIEADSPHACFEIFGVGPGDLMMTPKGQGTVVGIDNKQENLWFHLINDEGASFWSDIKSKQDLVSKGFKLIKKKSSLHSLFSKTQVSKIFDFHLDAKMQNPEGNCDITFLVEGKEIHAHAKEFSKCSTYFTKLFKRPFAKNWKIIPINECSYQEFLTLKNYLYTGRINLNFKNVVRFYHLADKYNLENLKDHCLTFFVHDLSKYNFVKYFSELQLFSHEHALKSFLLGFIKTHRESLFLDNQMFDFSLFGEAALLEFFGCFCSEKKEIYNRELFAYLNYFLRSKTLNHINPMVLAKEINFSVFTLEELFSWVDSVDLKYLNDSSLLDWARAISAINDNTCENNSR